MINMTEQNRSRINQLKKDLPEGLVVDAAWLDARGIASNLRAYYVRSGWLDQPARGVYRRPRGALNWQQVVISLQSLLRRAPFVVGGRTALDLQGFAHYLPQEVKAVYLYGPQKPPGWLRKLNLPQRFVYRNSATLFRDDPAVFGLGSLVWNIAEGRGHDPARFQGGSPPVNLLGPMDWTLTLSQPERAYLELLDELPQRESFHQADMIMQGAANFSPRRLQKLLVACGSVKVKRLFFFFAARHGHAWLKRLDRDAVDLGRGKRMLVPGGRLDPVHLITVPADLFADVGVGPDAGP